MIFFDFETRSTIDLIKLGATRYAIDPSTQVLCMSWLYDDEPDEDVKLWHRAHPWIEQSPFPDELMRRIRDGEPIEAHNARFEYLIWNECLRREHPEFDAPIVLEQLYCSAAKAANVSLPRALGDAVQAVHLEQRKDSDGSRLINKLSKPMRRRKADPPGVRWCEEEIEHRRNWAYNQQDVRAERGLSRFCPEMTETERAYWMMDFRMNDRGVQLDQPAVEAAITLSESETIRLNTEMAEITNGEVLGGSKRKAFLAWANKQLALLDGGTLPDTRADTLSFALYGAPTKAGDDAKAAAKPVVDAKWAAWGDTGKPLHRAMEICLEVNRSSVAKYRQMQSSVCPDGRLHDIMLYYGADRTGRWSGKGVQPHNFVRGYMADMGEAVPAEKGDPERGMKPPIWDDIMTLDLDYITLADGEPLPVLAKACRGALTASPGKELYAADFNAIEARKLAWMSGCSSLLYLFQTGGDPYCDMASAIYKREITKKDKSERQLGKKAILGLGYAMGWEKFQATVWAEEGIWLDDEFCQLVVKIYRKDKYPEIPKLWKSTEAAAINAVLEGGEHFTGGDELGNGAFSYFVEGAFLHCRLPSGRLLAYLYPEVHSKINYRYNALNERGKPCIVMFQSKVGVPMSRVHYHAEKMAEKAKKTLTGDPPESFLQPHLSFMGRNTYTHQWQRCGTHGGTLVENADQASSRDLLAEAMKRVDEHESFDLLLSIHDEVIAEAPIGTAKVQEFEAIMAEVPKWAPGMPVGAEGWIGPRLRK